MREILAELDEDDPEHPNADLCDDDSGWTLGAYSSGRMILENDNSDDGPRHLIGVSRGRMLDLWVKFSEGRFDELEAEPWLPGYGSDSAN